MRGIAAATVAGLIMVQPSVGQEVTEVPGGKMAISLGHGIVVNEASGLQRQARTVNTASLPITTAVPTKSG